MPSYRVITLKVDTPFGNNPPRQTLADFEKMVEIELIRGGKPVGGVQINVLCPDSGFYTLIYSQAMIYDV